MPTVIRAPGRRRRWYLLAAVVLTAALVARGRGLAVRSLWLDEAISVDNLNDFPPGLWAWAGPLPPLAYLGTLGLTRVLGRSEAVLRGLPFGFGVGLVALAAVLAGRAFPRRPLAAVCGLLLLAGNSVLIRYSGQLKPYAADAFWAALVVVLTEWTCRRPTPGRWAGWAGAAVLAIGFAYASLFVIPVAWAVAGFRRAPGRRRSWAAAGLAVGLAAAAAYLAVFRYQAGARHDFGYWAAYFLPHQGVSANLRWMLASTVHVVALAGTRSPTTGSAGEYSWLIGGTPIGTGLVVLVLAGLGTRRLVRSGRAGPAVLCWGPIGLALAAASTGRWAYGCIRTMSFAVPLVIFLVAEGVEAVGRVRIAPPWNRALAWMVLGLVCLPSVLNLNHRTRHVWWQEEMRPIVRLMHRLQRPGDHYYVHYWAQPAFRYYAPAEIPRAVFSLWDEQGRPDRLCWTAGILMGQGGRAWLIFSGATWDEERIVLDFLRRHRAYRFRRWRVTGVRLYLAEPADGSTAPFDWGRSGPRP